MVEAVENGYLETAISLSGEHAVPLEEVWSPEDDGILDRLVHNAYQLNLKGESMRKTRGPFTQADHLDS